MERPDRTVFRSGELECIHHHLHGDLDRVWRVEFRVQGRLLGLFSTSQWLDFEKLAVANPSFFGVRPGEVAPGRSFEFQALHGPRTIRIRHHNQILPELFDGTSFISRKTLSDEINGWLVRLPLPHDHLIVLSQVIAAFDQTPSRWEHSCGALIERLRQVVIYERDELNNPLPLLPEQPTDQELCRYVSRDLPIIPSNILPYLSRRARYDVGGRRRQALRVALTPLSTEVVLKLEEKLQALRAGAPWTPMRFRYSTRRFDVGAYAREKQLFYPAEMDLQPWRVDYEQVGESGSSLPGALIGDYGQRWAEAELRASEAMLQIQEDPELLRIAAEVIARYPSVFETYHQPSPRFVISASLEAVGICQEISGFVTYRKLEGVAPTELLRRAESFFAKCGFAPSHFLGPVFLGPVPLQIMGWKEDGSYGLAPEMVKLFELTASLPRTTSNLLGTNAQPGLGCLFAPTAIEDLLFQELEPKELQQLLRRMGRLYTEFTSFFHHALTAVAPDSPLPPSQPIDGYQVYEQDADREVYPLVGRARAEALW